MDGKSICAPTGDLSLRSIRPTSACLPVAVRVRRQAAQPSESALDNPNERERRVSGLAHSGSYDHFWVDSCQAAFGNSAPQAAIMMLPRRDSLAPTLCHSALRQAIQEAVVRPCVASARKTFSRLIAFRVHVCPPRGGRRVQRANQKSPCGAQLVACLLRARRSGPSPDDPHLQARPVHEMSPQPHSL